MRLDPEVRRNMGQVIRTLRTATEHPIVQSESLKGTLRAVHLDRDWLEVAADGEHHRVIRVGEQVDDVIGTMVNKPVIVHVTRDGGKLSFVDIEPDD